MSFGRSVIIAELWRPKVTRPRNLFKKFCVFLEKRPLMVNFSKFCSESFHYLTDRHWRVQISWNVADEKSAKSWVIYRTKNFACLSNFRYCADCAQNLLEPTLNNVLRVYSRLHPNRFTFDGVIAECTNTVKLPSKVNPVLVSIDQLISWLMFTNRHSLSSSRIINCRFLWQLLCMASYERLQTDSTKAMWGTPKALSTPATMSKQNSTLSKESFDL